MSKRLSDEELEAIELCANGEGAYMISMYRIRAILTELKAARKAAGKVKETLEFYARTDTWPDDGETSRQTLADSDVAEFLKGDEK